MEEGRRRRKRRREEEKRETNGCSVLGGVKDTGGVSRMVIDYGLRHASRVLSKDRGWYFWYGVVMVLFAL